jgi:hypothetical protein
VGEKDDKTSPEVSVADMAGVPIHPCHALSQINAISK